jgi:hypothetical protein
MNEEEIEAQNEILKEQKHISDLSGMIDYAHFCEYKENAINGLMLFGNKFQEALGMALDEAEDRDAVKIIRTWKNECSVHEMLYRMHVARKLVEGIEQQKDDAALLSHEL